MTSAIINPNPIPELTNPITAPVIPDNTPASVP